MFFLLNIVFVKCVCGFFFIWTNGCDIIIRLCNEHVCIVQLFVNVEVLYWVRLFFFCY